MTAMPTIDYEGLIVARAAQLAGRLDTEPGSEREALTASNLLQGLRKQVDHWTAIGNLYADTLESPTAEPALRNAVHAELEALEEAAGNTLATTEPALIRLLYPLLRDLAVQRQNGGQL
jgi:hypothetical protein